jgi:hypothetical protein
MPRHRDGVLINPDTKSHVGGVSHFGSQGTQTTHGTIIPDFDHPGFLAYATHADITRAAVMHRCNLATSTSANSGQTTYYNYATSAPTSSVGGGTWIYMGDYIPGCEKIAVWSPATGLYALDISTSAWTWSAQILAGPSVDYGFEPVNKRFFFMPDYDAFGVFNGQGQALYVLKRPTVFS